MRTKKHQDVRERSRAGNNRPTAIERLGHRMADVAKLAVCAVLSAGTASHAENFYLGASAGRNVIGDNNFGFGVDAGSFVTGNNNYGAGAYAGQVLEGDNNSAVGYFSGAYVVGSDNLAHGTDAGRFVTGADNIAIGHDAGGTVKGIDNKITNVANGIPTGTVRYDINADGTTNARSLTLGGQNAATPTELHNVAAGTAPNDAVNVQQLNATSANLQGQINAASSHLQNQIASQGRALSGGIAASAAMAVVTPVEPGRYHVSAAVAGYNGEAGVGFNLLKRSADGQRTLHVGLGWGSGGSKAIVRAGVGFSFD